MSSLPTLPSTFTATREALRSLACYAIAPARKARTGRIGLRPTGDGFGTPPFDDGSRILVRGDELVHQPGASAPITTVRAAADFLGVALSADPGVGEDLPPYDPDAGLAVDAAASFVLGEWYDFGQRAIDNLRATTEGSMSEAQLWPEHFDLAVTIELSGGVTVTVGFSPGDGFHHEPYAYVSPFDRDGATDPYWNAPFGAYLSYASLSATGTDAVARATVFVRTGLRLLSGTTAR